MKVGVVNVVSMIDGDFFDKLEEIARRIRGNDKPFGGIQILLSGDFLQLPPVHSKSTKFIFESKAWSRLGLQVIQLKQVYRQHDPKFVKILNEMRVGELQPDSIDQLRRLSRPLSGIHYKATHLYSLRNEVDAHNRRELAALSGAVKIFKANDTATDPRDRKKLNDFLLCPEILELRIGAQVMVCKNLRHHMLFNGSIGTVTGFADSEKKEEGGGGGGGGVTTTEGVYVEFEFDKVPKTVLLCRESFELEKAGQGVYASRFQVPLVLAYALSIHKSQGQTLHYVHVDLKSIFEKGQAYVALSRCTSLDGLVVKHFDPAKVCAHHKVSVGVYCRRLSFTDGMGFCNWVL
jgi:ATP-dependent DNA helicase PIF1